MTPQEMATLDQRLAEVDEIINSMAHIGAELAVIRDLDEAQTAALYAEMLSKQLKDSSGLDNTLLPLLVGRLFTEYIRKTSLLMMMRAALEELAADGQ